MAFEEIWGPLAVMFILAVFMFPAVYILDLIRQRVDPKSGIQKAILLFGIGYLLAMIAYPFAIPEDLLPLNSTYACYGLSLLFIFLVYLIVYNKTK